MAEHQTKHLISIKESVMRLLTANPGKWFSSHAITAHLQEELGRNIKPTSYLLRLVKSGHITRAHKPSHLINSKNGNRELIYKWSDRPYQDKIESIKYLPYEEMSPTDKAIIMRFLSAYYPGLPGWYQRIVL